MLRTATKEWWNGGENIILCLIFLSYLVAGNLHVRHKFVHFWASFGNRQLQDRHASQWFVGNIWQQSGKCVSSMSAHLYFRLSFCSCDSLAKLPKKIYLTPHWLVLQSKIAAVFCFGRPTWLPWGSHEEAIYGKSYARVTQGCLAANFREPKFWYCQEARIWLFINWWNLEWEFNEQ